MKTLTMTHVIDKPYTADDILQVYQTLNDLMYQFIDTYGVEVISLDTGKDKVEEGKRIIEVNLVYSDEVRMVCQTVRMIN